MTLKRLIRCLTLWEIGANEAYVFLNYRPLLDAGLIIETLPLTANAEVTILRKCTWAAGPPSLVAGLMVNELRLAAVVAQVPNVAVN